MKIVFLSNYYNHHQSALSEAFCRVTNGNYFFIQTQPMDAERRKMGWGVSELPAFVKESYLSHETYRECLDLINSADVVIAGSAPNEMLKERLKSGKLVFRYSERIYKNFKKLLTLPARFVKYHTYNYGSKNVYMLCFSAFAASDYAKTLNYLGKTYKFGYFPEVKRYDDIDKLIRLKHRSDVSILWTARFIGLKHPEAPIRVAKRLKSEGYSFELNMIGNGVLEEQIRAMVEREGLSDRVHLLGSMNPAEVRKHMERSEIFLFTSDRNEGWGAVLNESMNSGCAVVASHAIGSVPYLIKDGENGLIYKSGKVDDLYQKVKYLLDHPNERAEMGKRAYQTMTDEWNADIAAERFVRLAEAILSGEKKPDFYQNGPATIT